MRDNDVKFSTTSKRRELLIRNGYMYTLNKNKTHVKYWRCKERSCCATVHTDKNDQVTYHNDHHNHLPVPESIELNELRNKVKHRVLEESTPIAQIYDQELAAAHLTLPALSIAPTSKETQSSFQRLRRKTTPSLPVSDTFEIPYKYSQTLDDKSFLLCDETVRNKRVLLFATDLQLTIFFQSSQIFMDGTFDVCPPHFDQVFTMHCIHHDQAIPCIISLLPGRSAMVYQYIFDLLKNEAKELGLTFAPDVITSDFEPGLIKAIKRQFPTSRHKGCYFHHSQSVYRKIQSLGLSSQYNDDEEVRSHARKLMALPLLPLEKVDSAFEFLLDDHPPCLDPLFDYFESFWMESVPVELWNVSNIKIKTNNIAEGWHNRFAHRIEKKHPNIWHFIKVLQQEEVYVKQNVQHVKMGKKKKIAKKTCAIQECLATLAHRYRKKEITLIDYLDGLSLLVAKKK
ncbi:unnamed protein product [Adineta ricciae]|uniref:MULE transposase domain-containing protein n=1 Tax=Adineta ricciae TaxID=249248 RepID=A0A816GE83_ADIRI|nr:unnamed protein product [Adineta ricciae]